MKFNIFIHKDNKYLIQTFFYGMATLLSNISNFVIAIIFIYALAPAEYSKVVLLKTSLIMITSLSSLGISQGVVRWFNKDNKKNILLSSVVCSICFQAIFATFIYLMFLISFRNLININFSFFLIFIIIVLNASVMLNNEFLNWYRAEQDSKKYSIYTFSRSLLQITVIYLLIKNLNSYMSYIYGLAIAECILLFFILYSLRFKLSVKYNFSLIFSILKYSWPHALIISSGFVLNYFDRLMISKLLDETSLVAYYDAVSMLLLAVIGLISRPFNLFIFPAYTSKYENEGAEATVKFVERFQKYFMILLILLTLILVTFSELLISIFFPSEYLFATSIVPILLIGFIFNSLYVSSMAGLYMTDKPKSIAYASLLGVSVNILLNYFLIPRLGLDGAAIATSIGFICAYFYGYYLSKKILYIKPPFTLIFVMFSVILISYL